MKLSEGDAIEDRGSMTGLVLVNKVAVESQPEKLVQKGSLNEMALEYVREDGLEALRTCEPP